MQHIFQKGSSHTTLLLLHGTGGTERDLLPLADMIAPSANVLSVRGNVLENGMPRFFRRLAEGVFDIEDLQLRTEELQAFLEKAAAEYGFDREQVVAIGYSNGANIAGSLLFHYGAVLQAAILLHPMVPRRDITVPSLSGVPIFVGAGNNDPICPPQETNDLTSLLETAGAEVELYWHSYGHQLTHGEVEAAKRWLESKLS